MRRKAARLSGCISASCAIARTEKTSSWLVGRDDVPVAGEHDRPLLGEQLGGMRAQPLHPGELVGEFLGADRIAVGQIDRADRRLRRPRPRYSGCGVSSGSPGRPVAAQRRAAPRRGEDGDAVEALLAVPDAVIAGGADVLDREGVVGAFDLLQAERRRASARRDIRSAAAAGRGCR